VYISISGGAGQIYDICFAAIANLRRSRLFLHHHSFAYIGKPSGFTRLLLRIAGTRATHIVLSYGMGQMLSEVYGPLQTFPISNSIFVVPPMPSSTRERHEIRVIGFIGNISRAKGADEFLSLMARLTQRTPAITGLMAGPFQDSDTEQRIGKTISALDHVDYVGAVYGEDKSRFFDTIDLLVFPTRYRNEAEPIIVHEAMMHGVPVITYARGCLPEMLNADSGVLVSNSDELPGVAIDHINRWIENPATFTALSRSAAEKFARTRANSAPNWQRLQAILLDD
jgi:glycosyltransferase involved in cell wall biosynthesis